MEKELNIAAILKEKPTETKLWSPISGDCKYEYLVHDSICVWFLGSGTKMLSKKGNWSQYGETIIFPSKQMRDWSKFAWKKGDVLKGTEFGDMLIFKGWNNNNYTLFNAVFHCVDDTIFYDKEECFKTERYTKASNREAKEYIKRIEHYYGGKLNIETLEIEESKPEFKDGDIVYLDDGKYKFIFIFKYENVNLIYRYASFCFTIDKLYIGTDGCLSKKTIKTIRPATDSEKQQLLSSLAKIGKKWNPDTKQVEDLPKKCEFKPFDKVLVRNNDDYDDEIWKADIFSHYDADNKYPYACVGDYWKECIPYNDQTKHLLGTNDEWKGGEE